MTNTKDLTHQFTDHINGPASRQVAALLGHWDLYRYSETANTKTLRVIVHPSGKSVINVTRHQDGSLTWRLRGKPQARQMHFMQMDIPECTLPWITAQLIRHARTHLPKATFNIIMEPNASMDLRDQINTAATAISHDQVTNGNTRPNQHSLAASELNGILWDRFTDPDAARLTKDIFPTPETILSYNTVALNLQPFKALYQSDHRLLKFYCQYIIDPGAEITKLNHPGQIVQAIQEELHLTPAQWRVFIKCDPLQHSCQRKARNHTIQVASKALADANQPQANPKMTAHAYQGFNHHWFYQHAWSHGDSWKAWTHLISQWLAQDPSQTDTNEFSRVTDALKHSIQHDTPWGPGNWQALCQRAANWHRRIQQTKARDPKALQARWDSHLGTTVIGQYTFTAVTDGTALCDLAADIGNCLSTYWRNCQEGQSRIFRFTSDTGPNGAAELVHLSNSTWRPGQTETDHKARRLTAEIKHAVDILANRYQAAYLKAELTNPAS